DADGRFDKAKAAAWLESLPPSISGTYGGNTTSVEIQVRDSPLIMIDCGTGARLLGLELMKRLFGPDKRFNPLATGSTFPPNEVHLFQSHLHWDHIQGFPFFIPGFVPGTKIHIYGRANARVKLQEALAGQQEFPNFPVEFQDMAAAIEFHEMKRFGVPTQQVGSARVTPMELSHPDGVFGYRIDAPYNEQTGPSSSVVRHVSYVFATDTEHRDIEDPRLVELAKGAGVLYYDSQYTPEEYVGPRGRPTSKIDWGHSTFVWAVRTALVAEVPLVVLGHHEPVRDDFGLEELLARALQFRDEQLRLPENAGKRLDVALAREGMVHEF
ncbi:MBL fold metallo-hydrolase, partial [Candidatus Micrarchaeota archaeon]|nr:MBL fold metallo-hydrolase [Candidatus Micrarchaeota archaeon]